MKLLRHGILLLFCTLTATGMEALAQQAAAPASPPPSTLSPSTPLAAPTVLPPMQVSEAHRAAVARMLKAFHADELALHGLKVALQQAKEKDPAAEAYVREVFDAVTPAQMVDKMLPAYARYYSPAEADAIAQFFSTPVGAKFVGGMVKDMLAGRNFSVESLHLTPAEIAPLTSFLMTPTAQKIGKVQPMINQEVAGIMRAWGAELMRARMKKSMTPLVAQIDSDLASQGVAPGDAPGSGLKATPAGGQAGPWNAVANIGVAASKAAAEARQHYQDDVRTLGAQMLLGASGLTSADNIAASKKNVLRMGESLDRYLQSYDQVMKEAREKMVAIDLPENLKAALLQGFDIGLARSYDERIRYGENQRALLGLYQRLFEFAEARLGKISVADGKLVFADAADQEIYRTIIGQIGMESQREADLVKESQERVRKASNNLR